MNWKRPDPDGYEIHLPSGNKPRIRPVRLDRMLVSGTMPDLLTNVAAKALFTKEEDSADVDVVSMATEMISLVDVVCRASFVSPKIVDNPDYNADEISIEDVEFEDKVLVFDRAIQPTRVLETFCREQAASMDAVSDGKVVSNKTE